LIAAFEEMPPDKRMGMPMRSTAGVLMAGLVLGATLSLAPVRAGAQQAEPAPVMIGHLRLGVPRTIPISLLDRPAPDDGVAGARLAIDDNNTTGAFTKQKFELVDAAVNDPQQASDALGKFAAEGVHFVVTDLPAEMLLPVADAAAKADILVFNAGAPDDVLRGEECRGNVIHVTPSRAMLADALAQYLVWKKWTRWFLIVGSHEADQDDAAAVKRAAGRFGAKVVEERVYKDTGGARTTDTGTVQVQRIMPVFTQEAPEHDVVWTADESDVFGAYTPYRTWSPRPVVGSSGLKAASWFPAHDQWAGIQMQNRFERTFKRLMTAKDMDSWTAVRMIGEAATRANSTDPAKMTAFIKSKDFSVAAFKGQKLTIRDWDLQLRQPILLGDGQTVVSVSPQEGFLHQTSELDTLGYDRPETKCRLP
jgi:ABC transporter substrate binding protein (PQQ-dependent alcohol dehydrogenase system)